MCCHFYKPIKLSLKISVRNLQFNSPPVKLEFLQKFSKSNKYLIETTLNYANFCNTKLCDFDFEEKSTDSFELILQCIAFWQIKSE